MFKETNPLTLDSLQELAAASGASEGPRLRGYTAKAGRGGAATQPRP